MDIEDTAEKVSRVALVFSSALFFLLVSLIMLSMEEVISAFGGHSSWQVSIYEKMLLTMEIFFAALCLLQAALHLYTRWAAEKGFVSENLKMQVVGTHIVALSAWLMYAMFYGLAPMSASTSVKVILSTYLAYAVLVGLRTYSEANGARIVELVRRLVKKDAWALTLLGGGLVLYLSFLSCSLSEWDSFNFAQALGRFDLGTHQPHPPGYSLYVFLSKMVLAAVGDRVLALTSVSAVSGALCLLPVYVVVKKMHDPQTAVVTCLALMSTRMFWLASEKAITHMFGTFLMTSAICLLYLGLAGKRNFFLMS